MKNDGHDLKGTDLGIAYQILQKKTKRGGVQLSEHKSIVDSLRDNKRKQKMESEPDILPQYDDDEDLPVDDLYDEKELEIHDDDPATRKSKRLKSSIKF
jgi:hypothetical protein